MVQGGSATRGLTPRAAGSSLWPAVEIRSQLHGWGASHHPRSATDPIETSTQPVLNRLRSLLLGLVLFGVVGLGAELVLLEHWEAGPQRIPMILLVLTAAGAVGALLRPAPGVLRAFRWVLTLAVVSGVLGTVYHLRANMLLELEIAPDRPMGQILQRALSGGTPTLAPGAMIQLGLLGLLALYRHPGASAADADASATPTNAG